MDTLLAGLLFVASTVYLVQRRVGYMVFWIVITYLVSYNMFSISRTVAVILGILSVYLVSYLSTKEHFENEKKTEEKQKSEPASADPHVDLGTTILHAYRNLTPEQIGGMRRDTKELMELQKELMGTLAEMKPAIEQGAQLLGTFSQFFGQ
jgi:hypothetical protein